MPAWMSAWGTAAMEAARATGSQPVARIEQLLRMSPLPAGPEGPWIALAAAGLALLWAGRCLACALLPQGTQRVRWLLTLVLAAALQNATVLALSVPRWVSEGPILAAALAVAAALSPLGLRAGAARLRTADGLPAALADGGVGDSRAVGLRRGRAGPRRSDPQAAARPGMGLEPVAWLAVALGAAAVAAWYVLIVLVGLRLPEVSWDALAQHGASAAAWLQNGGVSIVHTDDYWLNVYPMNTEVGILWQFALLHRVNVMSLTQLPYALLGAVATYTLARGWGAGRAGAVVAGCCYMLVPNTIVQARTAYVDVAFCSLWLAALALWQEARARGTWGRWVAVGVALGLLAGTKPTGLLYGGVLGVSILLWPQVAPRFSRAGAFWQRAAARWLHLGGATAAPSTDRVGDAPPPPASGAAVGASPRTAVSWWWRLALVLAPTLLFGLRWYLRTYIAYGNPVFPFPIAFHGHTIFPGQLSLGHLLSGSTPPAYRGRSDLYMIRLGWLGLQLDQWYVSAQGWLGMAWPYLELPALALFILWGARRAGAWPALLATAVSFAFQPLNWWPRYTLFLPALGAAALASLPVPRWPKQVLVLAVAVLAAVGAVGAAPRLLFFVPAGAAVPAAKRQTGELFAASAYAWTVTGSRAGDHIGYADGPTLLLMLYGPAFDRRVTYVGAPTRAAWLRNLARDRITVFTTDTGSHYTQWMSGVPSVALNSDPSVSAWRILPAAYSLSK